MSKTKGSKIKRTHKKTRKRRRRKSTQKQRRKRRKKRKRKKTRSLKGGNNFISVQQIRNMITGIDNPHLNEFCGIFTQNRIEMLNWGNRSSCSIDKQSRMGSQGEWHAHTIASKYFPSPEDLLLVIRHPQTLSRIFTDFGYWEVKGDGGVRAGVRKLQNGNWEVNKNRQSDFAIGGGGYLHLDPQDLREKKHISRDPNTIYGQLNIFGDELYRSNASLPNTRFAPKGKARILNIQHGHLPQALYVYINKVNSIIGQFNANLDFKPY